MKARIAQSAVEELGYTYNQYVVVDHHRDDPGHDWNHDHDHIHIALNMITLDGKRVDDWQDQRKFEKILRQLEVSEQLTTVIPSKERKRKALSHGQTQRIKRELFEFKEGIRTLVPEIPLNIKLQAAIDQASEDQPDLTTFIGRLQGLNIDVQPSISDQGRKRISYRLENLKVRGSKLHNASFPKLISQRGIDFDLKRDKPAMDAASNGQSVSILQEKLLTWSEIDLVSYLPSAFHNDFDEVKVSPVRPLELSSQTEKASSSEPERNLEQAKYNLPSPLTERESTAKPDQLKSITRQQHEQVFEIAVHFTLRLKSEVWNCSPNADDYDVKTNGKDLLVIEAKDGRGEILRFQDGKINQLEQLTVKDFEIFQGIYINSKYQHQIAHTASRFLHLTGRQTWGEEQNSRNYNLSNEKGILTIEAKDGRGEILRRVNGKIVAQGLTLKDVERFQKINTALDLKLEQVKSQQQNQKQIKRGRGRSR